MSVRILIVVLLSVYICKAEVPQKNVKETDKDMKELKKEMMDDIHSHKVVVYSKTYCPYSRKLKKLLSVYKIDDLKIIEVDLSQKPKEMQDILKGLSGRTTVPQLFISGHFIGGHDETKAIDDKGELKPLLEKAHALSSNRVANGENDMIKTSSEALSTNATADRTITPFIIVLAVVLCFLNI